MAVGKSITNVVSLLLFQLLMSTLQMSCGFCNLAALAKFIVAITVELLFLLSMCQKRRMMFRCCLFIWAVVNACLDQQQQTEHQCQQPRATATAAPTSAATATATSTEIATAKSDITSSCCVAVSFVSFCE